MNMENVLVSWKLLLHLKVVADSVTDYQLPDGTWR